MRVLRMIVGVWLLAAVACTGTEVVQTSSPSPVVTASPLTCSKNLNNKYTDVPGAGRVLVPGQPVALVLCSNRSRTVIEGTDRVGRFVDRLNGLHEGIIPCEFFGTPDFYGLFFNYQDSSVLTVLVTIPCDTASNGRSIRRVDKPTMNMISSAFSEDSAA